MCGAGGFACTPQSAEREDALAGVLRAMGDLPDNQQECIRLKFHFGVGLQADQPNYDLNRHQRRIPDSHGAEKAEEGNGGRARVRE